MARRGWRMALLLGLGVVLVCGMAAWLRGGPFVTRSAPVRAMHQAADFRGVPWGASVQEVKQREKALFLSEATETLLYQDTVQDCTVLVTFGFIAGRLAWGQYACESPYLATDSRHRLEFERFRQWLVDQYQAPQDTGIATRQGTAFTTLLQQFEATQIDYARWVRDRTSVYLFFIYYADSAKQPTVWVNYMDAGVKERR